MRKSLIMTYVLLKKRDMLLATASNLLLAGKIQANLKFWNRIHIQIKALYIRRIPLELYDVNIEI